MAVVPWGYLTFINVLLGAIGILIQSIGLALMVKTKS